MTYTDFKTYSDRRDSNIGCLFKQANGQETEVPFSEVAPYITKVWVDFAMALEFTIPVFAILLGLARAHIYMRGARQKSRRLTRRSSGPPPAWPVEAPRFMFRFAGPRRRRSAQLHVRPHIRIALAPSSA